VVVGHGQNNDSEYLIRFVMVAWMFDVSSSGFFEGCSLRLCGQLSEDVCGIGCFF
jgi:hypothetical protein